MLSTVSDLDKAFEKAIARGNRVRLGWGRMDLSKFEKCHIALKSPLLIIKGSKGVLGCGYLNVEAFNRGGEAGAIVTGVRTHEDMLKAKVVAVSEAAHALGVEPGMSGEESLKRLA